MGGKGKGGSTSFENMSHEQMLAWLDQADSGVVQAAADKLKAAATEISKIAEELKVRPQYVTWKGKGADAFRSWGGDLANATFRLADFSEGSAKWLGHASAAIASAQSSVPRDRKSAQANLDAARAAHGDPDAHIAASKSESNLAAIAADKEKVRQEAAAEMRKLAGTYSFSATQMDRLERPRFPPPPSAISPEGSGGKSIDGAQAWTRPTTSGRGTTGGASVPSSQGHAAATHASAPGAPHVPGGGRSSGVNLPERHVEANSDRPTHVDIDSADTLPKAHHVPVHPSDPVPNGPSPTGPTGPTGMPPVTGTPPIVGRGGGGTFEGREGGTTVGRRGGGGPFERSTSPIGGTGATRPGNPPVTGGGGRSTGGMRGPLMPGQSGTGAGRTGSLPGRLPTNNGVAGGRPQQATGRPTTGIPRGTVMGGETPTGRGPVGRGAAGARPGATPEGPRGAASGRRIAGENEGIVGGRPQRQGRSSTRSFSSGGSGLVREQQPGGTSSEPMPGSAQTGRGGPLPNGSRSASRRTDERGERPDYLTEDEETWRPSERRNVPPVVD
ncbi:translation initiation factor IF-2 [Streptomyces sp. NPDC002004]